MPFKFLTQALFPSFKRKLFCDNLRKGKFMTE